MQQKETSPITLCACKTSKESQDRFKADLIKVFKNHLNFTGHNSVEVTIKITSGNIAWININCIEVIK
jgi:hypothetical protein